MTLTAGDCIDATMKRKHRTALALAAVAALGGAAFLALPTVQRPSRPMIYVMECDGQRIVTDRRYRDCEHWRASLMVN